MKKYIISILFTTLFLISCSGRKNNLSNEYSLVPLPNKITAKSGKLILEDEIIVSIPSDSLSLTLFNYFKEVLKNTSIKVVMASANEKSSISLIIDNSLPDEAYNLEISSAKIEIKSNDTGAGFFYAVQTLIQLMPAEIHDASQKVITEIILPAVSINDAPRFPYRGAMMDVARNFLPKETVLKFIDMMAVYKLNRLHMHLTDDQGWRIEIKKYPKLTTIGALGNELNPDAPSQYYTQEEIKEIVQFAAERFIQVIPEIDMPGHARAANRAYPEYSGGGSEAHPEFTFNPGKEETYAYLTDILREITTLFPSQYIHMGGDEVHFGNEKWNTDANVKQLMRREKLDNLKAVEHYFVHRMADSIRVLNKTVIGWDEIVDLRLSTDNSLVMWWRHDKLDKLQAAFDGGYDVVLCPRIPLYYDFDQDESHQYGRKWGGAYSPLDMVYAFPTDTLLDLTQNQKQIKGLQANIWTERIDNIERLDYMTHPRLSALAEACWTEKENKDFNNFKERLKPMLSYLDVLGIGYNNPYKPELTPEPISLYE